MSQRLGVMRYVLAVCLVLLVATSVAGCSSGGSGTDQTTDGLGAPVSASSSTSDSSTTTPVTLNQFDRALADTANVENTLAQYFISKAVPDSDPRVALIYGLRARIQALSCRKALDLGDTASADSAMKSVYSMINLGRGLAKDSVATTLESAYTTIKNLGSPSGAPDQAKQLLDAFIGQLKPLIDDANAITAATTTTAS